MIVFVTQIFAAIGRRAALLGGLVLIFFAALRIAKRQGRHAAEAEFVLRAAEARIRALQTSQEVRHEIETLPAAERDRRLDRWMRD